MKANYDEKLNAPKSEIAMGSLYDMNKQLMKQMPALNREGVLTAYDGLKAWFQENTGRYYMLLCNERHDYTLFNLDKSGTWKIIPKEHTESAANDVMECLTNRGALLAADLQNDSTWEFWIRDYDECFAYYLFPYDQAVIEY